MLIRAAPNLRGPDDHEFIGYAVSQLRHSFGNALGASHSGKGIEAHQNNRWGPINSTFGQEAKVAIARYNDPALYPGTLKQIVIALSPAPLRDVCDVVSGIAQDCNHQSITVLVSENPHYYSTSMRICSSESRAAA
jgi:hypothetical protein